MVWWWVVGLLGRCAVGGGVGLGVAGSCSKEKTRGGSIRGIGGVGNTLAVARITVIVQL